MCVLYSVVLHGTEYQMSRILTCAGALSAGLEDLEHAGGGVQPADAWEDDDAAPQAGGCIPRHSALQGLPDGHRVPAAAAVQRCSRGEAEGAGAHMSLMLIVQ